MRDDEQDNAPLHDDPRPAAAEETDHPTGAPGAPSATSGLPAATPSAPSPAGVPRLELSLTQILGSTAAAVTAAFLGSRLGVAGTLIGAGMASLISVVGGAIYTNSLKATRRRVAKVLVAVRSQDEQSRTGSPAAIGRVPARPAATTRPRAARTRRPGLRVVLVGGLVSAAVFAGALVVVTGYETVSGSAISSGKAGGLTILGGDDSGSGRSTRTPTGTTGASTSATTADGTDSGGAPVSGAPSDPSNVRDSPTAASSPATDASTAGAPSTPPSPETAPETTAPTSQETTGADTAQPTDASSTPLPGDQPAETTAVGSESAVPSSTDPEQPR